LMIKSFIRLQSVDPGFDPHNLLTMEITLPPARYGQNQQQIAFFQQALDRIKTLPGVQAAGAVQDLPLRFNVNSFPVSIEGRAPSPTAQQPLAGYRAVTGDYFRTLRIPLLRGRLFTAEDGPDVGVVGDIKHMGLGADEGPVMYQPHTQKRFAWLRWMTVVVRTEVEPLTLSAAVRSRVQEVDRDLPVYNVETMDQLLKNSVAQPRFSTLLLGSFALLAMSLTAIGIYGVVSYGATLRTHEIGIRMALGARAGDILKLVIRNGATLTLIGVAIGLGLSFALTRVMTSLLFGVTPTDAMTFVTVSACLVVVTLLACFLPARRATKVDPLVALRYE
jgi:hypothetical protein